MECRAPAWECRAGSVQPGNVELQLDNQLTFDIKRNF